MVASDNNTFRVRDCGLVGSKCEWGSFMNNTNNETLRRLDLYLFISKKKENHILMYEREINFKQNNIFYEHELKKNSMVI